MRTNHLRAAIVALFAAAAPAQAAPDPLGAFLAKNRCPVADRLRRVFDAGDPTQERDRFLIVDFASRQQTYVQCLFHDDETMVVCEAASGFYLNAIGAPRTMRLAPAKIAALGRLGFSTDDHADNFKLDIPFRKPPDFGALADLMLRALYLGYDARPETVLRYEAPFAPGPAPACDPVG